MTHVIVYKPSPYGLVFIHDKPLGFIIYQTKHDRVYVSSKPLFPSLASFNRICVKIIEPSLVSAGDVYLVHELLAGSDNAILCN